MINLGCHLSSGGGFEKMAKTALEIGANTFQFFLRNPRGGAAKALVEKDVEGMGRILLENHFAPVLAHAPYTLNMASATEKTREFAKEVLIGDLKRMDDLPCDFYNLHPGSHTTLTLEEGIEQITQILNQVMTSEMKGMILLETMSGKGSEIGRNFRELKQIIEKTNQKEKIGICLDTCHLFASGYDIVNNLEGVFEELDQLIGMEKVKMVHLNDSLMPFGSQKDRHAGIGFGEIGMDPLLRFMTHKAMEGIPFILETPYDAKEHGEEIAHLKSRL